ncbi:hypothetical protein KW797_00200 [Candidatus Parcubacteria bacterium]|nr:hypothetical protein [Candidatus Parcubacteria bacterium]
MPPFNVDLNACHQRRPFDPAKHSDAILYGACLDLFHGCAPDLNLEVEDPSDPAFQDFCGDRLADFGVPSETIDRLLAKLKGNRS